MATAARSADRNPGHVYSTSASVSETSLWDSFRCPVLCIIKGGGKALGGGHMVVLQSTAVALMRIRGCVCELHAKRHQSPRCESDL